MMVTEHVCYGSFILSAILEENNLTHMFKSYHMNIGRKDEGLMREKFTATPNFTEKKTSYYLIRIHVKLFETNVLTKYKLQFPVHFYTHLCRMIKCLHFFHQHLKRPVYNPYCSLNSCDKPFASSTKLK